MSNEFLPNKFDPTPDDQRKMFPNGKRTHEEAVELTRKFIDANRDTLKPGELTGRIIEASHLDDLKDPNNK